MSEPLEAHRLPLRPEQVPGLVAFWDFQQTGGDRPAVAGEPYRLHPANSGVERVEAPENPWGPYATYLPEGTYLVCPRAECPGLDIHGAGPAGHLTVIAWLRRDRVATRHCEFIAGQWNETHGGRQYGLFLDIGVWGGTDQVCGHVSTSGGPTPGYRYCMDGAIGATAVECGRWCCVAMSYDGTHAYAWLDGRLDVRAGVNPYLLPGGLHDGGPHGSDFTVGAVDRSGEMGNFFTGLLGGLAVYRRALSPAEMWALARPRG